MKRRNMLLNQEAQFDEAVGVDNLTHFIEEEVQHDLQDYGVGELDLGGFDNECSSVGYGEHWVD